MSDTTTHSVGLDAHSADHGLDTASNGSDHGDHTDHHNDEGHDLTMVVADRHDVAARVERHHAVCLAGCEHSAVRWNGRVELVSCPACASNPGCDC